MMTCKNCLGVLSVEDLDVLQTLDYKVVATVFLS